ncbi:hypothetical protein [Streptomyces fuscichromogenes]|uniref:Uncharacterized protein n=1 Tax=Streptomyces fuscichromogenes TaxID=1324013 RepID=A0A917XQC6_9ACTN|nr:hypothetical protein [Streptomyces fuscichromogenes]GGN47543.1 hypothetical protein GCM10011578_101170 [Streptomyces fuscichromogenes]
MISAAATDTIDWRRAADRLVNDTPTWVFAVAAGAVLVTVLIVGAMALSRSSKQQAERDKHHSEAVERAQEKGQPLPPKPLHMDPKPLIGGIAVSLNGLWGFAQDTVGLSFFFAVGFVSMFDVLEMRLFSDMYKMANADPRRRWTRQLKLMRATAWGFVFASAAANVVHAPNVWAAPFLAVMPIGAAWVIYVPLQNALAGEDPEEETKRPEGTKPGPFRLAGLLWRRLWAWGFRVAGLDVNDRADEMVRRARARDAADASYALRKVLKEKEQLEAVVGTAVVRRGRGKVSEEQKRLDVLNRALEKKVRPKAQTALELAETQDPEQGLQLMQRMAWLTRADDVAMLDYGPNSPAMQVLEELNIAANADFLKSRKRAQDADQKAAEAEEIRRNAEKAVAEAGEKLAAVEKALEETRKQAEEAQQQAAAERETEANRLKAIREERTLLESSDATAAQLYQKTAEELDALKGQMNGLQEERGRLSTAYDQVQKQAQEASEKALRLEGEQRALTVRLETLQAERARFETEATNALKEAEEARNETEDARRDLVRLQGQMSALDAQRPVSARAQQSGRVDARIGSAGGDSRQRVRDLLDAMSPEERSQSQRKLAEQLMGPLGLSLDGVRNHLRAIKQEDEEAAGVPNPRAEQDSAEEDSEDGEE